MRLTLRNKLLLFAALIAALPLLVAGQSLIRIAQDELKSTANEQLISAATQITDEVNDFFDYVLGAPLDLIRNSIDGSTLGIQEKIAVLKQGIADLPDIVALQLSVEGIPVPMVVTRPSFVRHLEELSKDAVKVLQVSAATAEALSAKRQADAEAPSQRVKWQVERIEGTDDWIATAMLPLETGIQGREAVLYARANLARLKGVVEDHPFARTGTITLVDDTGMVMLGDTRPDLKEHELAGEALRLLAGKSRVMTVEPYRAPGGETVLGAFSFPRPLDWAVLVEKREGDAYAPVTAMIRSLGVWITVGLLVAAAGAVMFSLRISRPILNIGSVATKIAEGDLKVRVEGVRTRDEIGDLAQRFNTMIQQLQERFELQKFVSRNTMQAIVLSGDEGVKLGGERREAAVLFADIRGYTAFSEDKDPETVVDVLNLYFQAQSDIVTRNGGDIDKFVGDQIMAVFYGDDMGEKAVRCALEIQHSMEQLRPMSHNAELDIGIGINLGEMVMGAMGSTDRMDFTVLGDHVNLAARLCSAADRGQTLISQAVRDRLPADKGFVLEELKPIRVKGKKAPIPVYAVK